MRSWWGFSGRPFCLQCGSNVEDGTGSSPIKQIPRSPAKSMDFPRKPSTNGQLSVPMLLHWRLQIFKSHWKLIQFGMNITSQCTQSSPWFSPFSLSSLRTWLSIGTWSRRNAQVEPAAPRQSEIPSILWGSSGNIMVEIISAASLFQNIGAPLDCGTVISVSSKAKS